MNNICPNCNSKIYENAQFCTNCGMQLGSYSENQVVVQVSANANKTNGFSIAGFVLSLVNPLACFYLTSFALIFSIIGMILSKTHKQKGYGLGLAGLIITVAPFVLVVLALFLGELFSY